MHRTDSLSEILTKEGVLTFFDLFLVELMKELFKQIRLESTSQNLDLGNILEIYTQLGSEENNYYHLFTAELL